jgi:flagella basal body P-ring formation protein FlgA
MPLVPPPPEDGTRILRVREVQELLEMRGANMQEIQLRGASRIELRGSAVVATAASVPVPRRGKVTAVVATRHLNRGDVIREGDVECREISLSSRGLPPATSVDDVLGLELINAVAAGQPIDKSTLQPPLLIQRGATVSVFARVGGIQVTAVGRALEDGARDDLITVALVDGRDKRVTGRVVGPDAVEVFAQAAAVAPAHDRPGRSKFR